MHTAPRAKYLGRDLLFNRNKNWLKHATKPMSHKARIEKELLQAGASHLSLASSESRYLPRLIHPDEHIGGVVYGLNENGFVMLVATNWRVIFLDKKPLFINEDEINYGAVSGVKFSHAGFGSTVTLHTRVRDFTIQTYNQKCAKNFVDFIEGHSFGNNFINNYNYN